MISRLHVLLALVATVLAVARLTAPAPPVVDAAAVAVGVWVWASWWIYERSTR